MKTNYNGEYLRELRIKKGITQEELSDILGISRQMLSYYENGTKSPSMAKAKELANYYNVSLLSILYGNENIEDKQKDKLNNNCKLIDTISPESIVLGRRDNQNVVVTKNIVNNILNVNNEKKCYYDNFSQNQIINSAKNNENIVVYTSNKDIYNNTYYELIHNGYDIKVFNMSSPLKSDSWQLLDDLNDLSYKNENIEQFLSIFDKNKESNKLIKKAKTHLFNSLSDYIRWHYDMIKTIAYEYKRDFGMIRFQMKEKDIKEWNAIMEKEPIYKCSKEQWDLFSKYNDDIKEMAYLELLCDFEIFDSLEIKNTTRTNDISCKNIFNDKIAIFIITPIINSSYNELANAFVNALMNWVIFYKTSIKENNNTQINFIFDEFPNDVNVLNLDMIKKLNACNTKIYLNINTLYPLKKYFEEIDFFEFIDKFNLKFISNNINKKDFHFLDISTLPINNNNVLIKFNDDEFIVNRYNEDIKCEKYDLDAYIPKWKEKLNALNFHFGIENIKEMYN